MVRLVPDFHGFVGQSKVVAIVRRQAAGAKERGEAFPSTCIRGRSGLGKTYLARAMACHFETKLTKFHGSGSLERLREELGTLRPFDFLFVDEAHNLVDQAQEYLYEVIDCGHTPNVISESGGDGGEQNQCSSAFTPCTIVLATDQPGKLQDALHKRIELNISLSYYTVVELRDIVDRLARDLNLLISPNAANFVARVSGGVPRQVRHYLQNLCRHFADSNGHQLSIGDVREFLRAFGIDANGLERDDRRYLRYLHREATASVETLSLHLGHDVNYVRRQIEPKLLRNRFITIGRNGRQLTSRGREWLNRPRKSNTKGNR